MSPLWCLGLSHATAPLAVRERLALSEPRKQALLERLLPACSEVLYVSTCNRVELYGAGSDPELSLSTVREAVAAEAGAEALEHLYEHKGDSALVHLFRVSSSLDSMVLGEAQILGQVKEAFEAGRKEGWVRGELTRACSAAFSTAKRVRSETAIGQLATSMASASVELAKKVFGGLEGRGVLVLGAGEMAALAAKHLASSGAKPIWVVNRTFDRAEELAATVGGKARRFEELAALLTEVDVVICSTGASEPILNRAKLTPVLKARRYRPLFIVDLAVPRNVDPDINRLEGIYSYDVDDIQKVVIDNSRARSEAAAEAEAIIGQEIARFVQARAIREGAPVLTQLRSHAQKIARAELEKTLAVLGSSLNERQRQSVEAMANAIVNKLLHSPTTKLRTAAISTPSEPHPLLGAAVELFGLEVTPLPLAERSELELEEAAAEVLTGTGTQR